MHKKIVFCFSVKLHSEFLVLQFVFVLQEKKNKHYIMV